MSAADHARHAGLPAAGMTVLAALCLVLLGVYVLAAAVQWGRSRRWSGWRVASAAVGSGMIVAALLPPVAPWAHHDLRAHMVQHLLLGMIGPLGVVLGAPVTLALRSLPPAAARRVVALLHGGPARFVVHPVTALVLSLGGMAVLYMTPLYAQMQAHPPLHVLVHVHFVAAGCLFAWAIAGAEPAAPVAPVRVRMIVVFLAIAGHAVLSKAMYAYGFPRGTAHSGEELEDAARIMYYGGDLAELLLVMALFATASRGTVHRLLGAGR